MGPLPPHALTPGPVHDAAAIAAAAAHLRAGRLVAFPTETVYGLGAEALNPDAVARVFALKGRPAHNPLIVHVTDVAMARGIAASWPDWAHALAGRFWPGPLTIVLPSRPHVPLAVRAGGPTVALRAPAHPIAQALLDACGSPLVGPSANRSGFVSPTTAAHVQLGFPEAVGRGDLLVLDGGPCHTGIESTVVSMDPAGTLRVLRPGTIGPAALAQALGGTPVTPVTLGTGPFTPIAPGSTPLPSPGLLASHYAPRARAILIDRAQWPALLASGTVAPEDALAVLARGDWSVPEARRATRVMALPPDAPSYARGLYAALRDLDAASPSLIVIEGPPAAGSTDADLWAAIADRLSRAAQRWPE